MSAGSLHHKSRRSHRNRQQCQRWGETKERVGRQGGEEEGLAKKDTERRQRSERARGIAWQGERRVNSVLTLSVQTPVNRLLSAPAERLLTEPWKHSGMDQLCPKLHTTADKGCTEAGDQLSFAQTGLRLQKNSSDNCIGNSFYSYIKKRKNILTIYLCAIRNPLQSRRFSQRYCFLYISVTKNRLPFCALRSNLKRESISRPVLQLLVFANPHPMPEWIWSSRMMISESLQAKSDQV